MHPENLETPLQFSVSFDAKSSIPHLSFVSTKRQLARSLKASTTHQKYHPKLIVARSVETKVTFEMLQ